MSSVGENRVRIKFNPSANSTVDLIKQKAAELINLCADQKRNSAVPQEQLAEEQRLWALAMTDFENAAMWAVKAATFGK